MSDDYEVGYGKPPKHSRFKKGQSGNPHGRPPKSRNFSTDLRQELDIPITVRESGAPREITRQQALIIRTLEQALAGDLKAISMMVTWIQHYHGVDVAPAQETPLAEEDLALLRRHAKDFVTSEDGGGNTDE